MGFSFQIAPFAAVYIGYAAAAAFCVWAVASAAASYFYSRKGK